MRRAGVMAAFALSACLDAPPRSIGGDGGPPGDDASFADCVWSEPEELTSPSGVTGPTLDGSETILIVEEADTLGYYERSSNAGPFGNVGGFIEGLDAVGVEANPSLTANGLDLYFTRGDPESAADVWVAHRTSTDVAFSDSQLVVGLSDPGVSENGVAVWATARSREILYQLPGDGLDLAHAVCTIRDICEPAGFFAGVNTSDDEVFPTISADGRDLYFVRYGQGIFSAHRDDPDSDFVLLPAPPIPARADVTYHDPEVSEDGKTLYLVGIDGTDPAFLLVSHLTCP